MLEVEGPAVTPECVLKASGHVDRFQDLMVSDAVTGECFRADHIAEARLEAALERGKEALPADCPALADNGGRFDREACARDLAGVEGLGAEELGALLARYGCRSDAGNALSAPFPFNLMFRTTIGPRGDQTAFLRPETAQGIFVNFRDLLFYAGGRLPFAAAQIGSSFRNEIAPRSGLLRVREFQQAEIEHFCHPDRKDHPRFGDVAGLKPRLFSRGQQEQRLAKDRVPLEDMTLGEAVRRGVVANETLGYFLGRTLLFFRAAGLDEARVRFRQHLSHEMAHYATDCWDGEVETSYGWIECCGLADRSAYDLTCHARASGTDLRAFEAFERPAVVEELTAQPDRRAVGLAHKGDAARCLAAVAALDQVGLAKLRDACEAGETFGCPCADGGAPLDVAPGQFAVAMKKIKKTGESFVPSVIEPSFGVGRILYALFEHAYYERDDAPAAEPGAAAAGSTADGGKTKGADRAKVKDKGEIKGDVSRTVFRFSPAVAPVKATVFPLMARAGMPERAAALVADLRRLGLASVVDATSVTIGKRYARTDEIGVPFAVTVDHRTVGGGGEGGDEEGDGTVTVRERDTMGQIRVPGDEVAGLVRDLCEERTTWEEARKRYPAQE